MSATLQAGTFVDYFSSVTGAAPRRRPFLPLPSPRDHQQGRGGCPESRCARVHPDDALPTTLLPHTAVARWSTASAWILSPLCFSQPRFIVLLPHSDTSQHKHMHPTSSALNPLVSSMGLESSTRTRLSSIFPPFKPLLTVSPWLRPPPSHPSTTAVHVEGRMFPVQSFYLEEALRWTGFRVDRKTGLAYDAYEPPPGPPGRLAHFSDWGGAGATRLGMFGVFS